MDLTKNLFLLIMTLILESISLTSQAGPVKKQDFPLKDNSYFTCKSKVWKPVGNLDKIIYISSCTKVPFRLIGTPEKTAEKICSQWAEDQDLGDNFQTLFFEDPESCDDVVNKDFKFNLEINRYNKVQYLSSSHPKTGKTTAYLNQRYGEKPIINPDQTEQAQWIKSGDLTYCGFVNADIGFYTNLGLLEVIHFKSQERAIYEYTEEGYYKIYEASENIKTPYLEFNYPKRGQATVQFFEIENNERKLLNSYKMTYKDWNDNVTASECY